MKTKMAIGVAMLLALGSSLAGGKIYQKETAGAAVEVTPVAVEVQEELTPATIAKWRATAADYSPALLPI
ncbi:MAG TPA: hypothetical protein VIL28_13200 [Steroidobacteraceae bacterium]